MKIDGKWMLSGALLGLMGMTTPVWAGDFDERGKLDVTGAALSMSFDDVPGQALGQVVTFRGSTIDASYINADTDGLEGEGAMILGGSKSGVVLAPGQSWDQFKGRRVEVSMWYKPQGTSLYAYVGWISGDGLSYFQGGGAPVMMMGSVNFHPTGRATSDGWVELSTGPFDYEMGGLTPDWVLFRDTQDLLSSQRQQQVPKDRSARVLVDALEVHDLGPAAVNDVSCNGANQDAVCGAQGVCLAGRCVDAAAGFGNAPVGDIGDQYIARRLFEIDAFSAPRLGRTQLPEVTTRLQGLDPTTPKSYWQGFSQAHELLLDGHGGPPGNAAAAFYHPSGVCFGPGVADLSADPARRAKMLPMVFSANANFDVGAQLERGDVLVEIDGLDPWAWTAAHPQYFYYNGDPASREAISTLYIMQAAKKVGSTLTFERCTRTDGVPCQAGESTEISVDLGATLGEALWSQNPPADLYNYTNACDMRFEREVSVPLNAAAYYFSGWKDVGGVRHLLINGVPGSNDQQGANWHNNINSALGSGPSKVVVDQRTGYGGQMEGVARVIGQLVDPGNFMTTIFIPWVGQEIQGPLWDVFKGCMDWAGGGSSQACGSFFSATLTEIVNTGGSRSSAVALLNGFDVSGNDYLSRFIQYRTAPTRIFGYGPAIGAYGVSCSFASPLWERQGMRYQCHDSVFSANKEGPFSGFESGIGVAPDEVVYQLQSDAMNGEDSMIKAAHQWLATQGEVMP